MGMRDEKQMYTTTERSRGVGKRTVLGSVCGAIGISAVILPLIGTSIAGREVLSDMDCVVEPSALVDIGSAVPGLLSETLFDRSDYVSTGTVLAHLESEVERVSLSIAREVARANTAGELRAITAEFGQRTASRNRELLAKRLISEQTMDQVQTESTIADLQVRQELESGILRNLEVDRAQALLDRRVIRSTIDGVVVQRLKSAGEYVDSDAVFRVAQLDPLHVEVIVPIEYLGSLEAGMNAGVTLNVPGYENKVLSAEVRRIDAVADPASATYGVLLVMDNPDLVIPSGVRCAVDFFAS